MRQVFAGLVILMASAVASAQGITGFFRSVTGALQGGQPAPQEPAAQKSVTPVMGVRGMDQADGVATAPPADEEYLLMEGWASSKPEAEAMARKKGLVARPAVMGKAEVRDAKPQ